MKYTLLKKWHPSQVEEVGHVFEASNAKKTIGYKTTFLTTQNTSIPVLVNVYPHEIALLCEAGYLEKESEKCKHEAGMLAYLSMPQQYKCKKCGEMFTEVEFNGVRLFPKWENYTDPQLELWTEEPPKYTNYWYVGDDGAYWEDTWGDIPEDQFRLRTKNCHKTQKSAEEALKRLIA